MKYTCVGLGGTFDHFHTGHQSFLQQISAQAQHLVIGITQPALIKSKAFANLIEPYAVRAQTLADFCKQQHISHQLVPLSDMYGPTLTDKSIEAVFVTTETEPGGHAINTKRSELGLSELPVHVITLLPAADGAPIASKRIRSGEISRSGTVYKQLFTKRRVLNASQRAFFSQLHGEIVKKPTPDYAAVFCCVVGDSSFETFTENKWQYSLGVIDFKKQREPYIPTARIRSLITAYAANPAGQIFPEFAAVFQSELHSVLQSQQQTVERRVIQVEGEEDLAAVVAVLLLPLESTVYYGQPEIGLVQVRVTEEIKAQFYKILADTSQ